MGKYQDFGYGEDVYGGRVRTDVPITITNLGYSIDGAGDSVPDVLVKVGPVSWEYAGNSRVAILQSPVYYPPNPDRFTSASEIDGSIVYEDRTPVLWDSEEPSGRTYYFRSGDDTLGRIAPGVLYISVYVSEPYHDPKTGDFVKWLPWDYRGRAWAVIPGNYGGIQGAMDSLPRGVMTGGLIYGEHVMNPTTSFLADHGYVLDTVITDGEIMVETPERIHPNMVLPLLRAFGMNPIEEAFFTDRVVNHRLKHILANYRQITMAKGSYAGLQRYVETVTGFPTVVRGPMNLLLDRSDTCPDNTFLPPQTNPEAYTVSVEGGRWEAVPTRGYEPEGAPDSNIEPPMIPGALVSGNPGYEPDPWEDPRSRPAVGWVHQITPTGEARFGSRKVDGQYVPEYSALVQAGQLYQFRFRYHGTPENMAADLVFLNSAGEVVSTVTDSTVKTTSTVGFPPGWRASDIDPVRAPEGAKYVSWAIRFTGGVTRFGCISLTRGFSYAYRDPRAVAVVMNTGISTLKSGRATMDSKLVIMDDPKVTMEARDIEPSGESSLDSFERVLIAKLYGTLPAYLPSGVQAQLITSDDPEFSQLWSA